MLSGGSILLYLFLTNKYYGHFLVLRIFKFVVGHSLQACWSVLYFSVSIYMYMLTYTCHVHIHVLGLYIGPNNVCYVTRPFLFFSYVAMSLFIRP